MADPFIGEIRMFAGNYAPRGWALCNGQLLSVQSSPSLFAIFGTTYGGDGIQTFGLPDLRGRLPIHQGTGPGLSRQTLGFKGGSETETISVSQLPLHTHQLQASTQSATAALPQGMVTAKADTDIYNEETPGKEMDAQAITTANGGGQPHDNVMPFQCVSFIVALNGTYPSKT